MRRAAPALALVLVAAAALAQERAIPLDQLKSGSAFLGADLLSLQKDEFANPGMLWVERGEKLWSEPAGRKNLSCADCHQDAKSSMRGVAARYPRIDAESGKLLNLEGRINLCRGRRMGAEPLRYESGELLSLTAYLARQSRGMPVEASIAGAARARFDAGERAYRLRRGQMNLSCAHCHETSWGKRLLSETISQGHPNAYPVYRMEWQTMGSLQRRLRACLSGIRAEMLPYGSPEYLDLELYLAWRAQGLPVETPGVRR
ncbi:MAG TPA: sulfur oxidation c-type cytochrome SoxA [Burkholderiales bacterium]|nr:sulfur oxidation c-type cytochrome SoxA [Burkholderiales bacterium]